MKNKIYLAALLLSWSCLTTGASAQEVQGKYDSFQQQEENIIKYQKLIKEDWHNTKAHNDLGESYLKLRRLEEAEKEFKAALETDRVYSMGPFLFGDIYTDAERYKDKISDFKNGYKHVMQLQPRGDYRKTEKFHSIGVRFLIERLVKGRDSSQFMSLNVKAVVTHSKC